MRIAQRAFCLAAWLLCVLGFPEAGFGQWTPAGGPLTGPPVQHAEFSADGTTIVRQTLTDGTRIEQTATTRYYRDRDGRVRVEQAILGLEALGPAASSQLRITVWPNPADWRAYTLDPRTQTARIGPREFAGLVAGGGATFAVPLGGVRFLVFHGALDTTHGSRDAVGDESLGSRRIAGVDTIGRRLTLTVPVGQLGNDRPLQITEERWESPELHIVIYARVVDPRTGIVEYQLSNISRAEPPPSLFVVPGDYTVVSDDKWIALEFAENGRSTPARTKR